MAKKLAEVKKMTEKKTPASGYLDRFLESPVAVSDPSEYGVVIVINKLFPSSVLTLEVRRSIVEGDVREKR